MTIEEIALQQEHFINQIVTGFTDDFDRIFREAQRSMSVFIAQGGNALQADAAWIKALSDAGYYDLVDRFINEDFDLIYDNLRKSFDSAGLNMTFTKDDVLKVTGLKNLDMEYFTSLANDSAQTVKSAMYKYTLSDMSVNDMIAQISTDLAATPLQKYSTTYALTSITHYQQDIINIASQGMDALPEYAGWVYVGVLDDKTRDFCRHILNESKVYTQDEKLSLENDDRRRYNCRHEFHPISFEAAKAQGYES